MFTYNHKAPLPSLDSKRKNKPDGIMPSGLSVYEIYIFSKTQLPKAMVNHNFTMAGYVSERTEPQILRVLS